MRVPRAMVVTRMEGPQNPCSEYPDADPPWLLAYPRCWQVTADGLPHAQGSNASNRAGRRNRGLTDPALDRRGLSPAHRAISHAADCICRMAIATPNMVGPAP